MKKKVLTFLIILFVSLFFLYSADYKTDLTKYVAIGDSLTAGYQSGGLVSDFQEYSFPNIIATQLGITDFQQPLISYPGIPAVMQLQSLSPISFYIPTKTGTPLNLNLQRPYDNLGIPGATLYTCLNPPYSSSNAFYNIVLRGLGNAISQAISLQPKIVTFWLGNNEILGGVTSGKVIEGVTVFPVSTYSLLLDQALAALTAANTKIVIMNIPDVTAIPFVNALSIYITNPTTGEIVKDGNGNPITYIGPKGPMTTGWYITLGAMSYISAGYGIPVALGGNGLPLPDEVTLSPDEISKLSKMVSDYNKVISDAAKKYNAVLVDINSFFNNVLKNGYKIGGVTLTGSYLTGGIFSYDGVHPTSLGYAVIANKIIEKINSELGYKIPLYSYSDLMKKGSFLVNNKTANFEVSRTY